MWIDERIGNICGDFENYNDFEKELEISAYTHTDSTVTWKLKE